MGNFLSKREQELKSKQKYDILHNGRWPNHPFVWMRRLYLWREARKDRKKLNDCRKNGHQPGVVWYIDSLPYPPSEYNGKVECSFVGGGVSDLRAFCKHCWNHYDMFSPVGEQSLKRYVNREFPKAVFIDSCDYNKISKAVKEEIDRINSSKI